MKNIKYFVFVFFLPIIFFSCSDIEFGDKFLGEAPESSGATLDTMFNSKVNADKVLTKAYTYVPYGLPGGGDNKLGGNILEALTDLYNSLILVMVRLPCIIVVIFLLIWVVLI